MTWQKLAVLEVNYLKWKCLKRKKCNDCWWPNKMKLLLMATLWCGGQAHLSPKSKCIFWVIHQLSNSPTPFHIEANNALWPSQKYELRKSILRRRNFSYHFRCLSHEGGWKTYYGRLILWAHSLWVGENMARGQIWLGGLLPPTISPPYVFTPNN